MAIRQGYVSLILSAGCLATVGLSTPAKAQNFQLPPAQSGCEYIDSRLTVHQLQFCGASQKRRSVLGGIRTAESKLPIKARIKGSWLTDSKTGLTVFIPKEAPTTTTK